VLVAYARAGSSSSTIWVGFRRATSRGDWLPPSAMIGTESWQHPVSGTSERPGDAGLQPAVASLAETSIRLLPTGADAGLAFESTPTPTSGQVVLIARGIATLARVLPMVEAVLGSFGARRGLARGLGDATLGGGGAKRNVGGGGAKPRSTSAAPSLLGVLHSFAPWRCYR
jgi:hypothetical protein